MAASLRRGRRDARSRRATVHELRYERMRALVVTNMWPTPARPALGSFVRDQVEALRRDRRRRGRAVRVPAGRRSLRARRASSAARYRGAALRRRPRPLRPHRAGRRSPPGAPRVVTLHGTDLRHPRSRLADPRALLAVIDLPRAVIARRSRASCPRGRRAARRRAAVRRATSTASRPIPRAEARAAPRARSGRAATCSSPPTRARPAKRHDRARELPARPGCSCCTLGGVDPPRCRCGSTPPTPSLVPSEHEGFGLAVLEALACDVPVLATPTGIHPSALRGHRRRRSARPATAARWCARARGLLRADADPRVAGRARAERYSATRWPRACSRRGGTGPRRIVPRARAWSRRRTADRG